MAAAKAKKKASASKQAAARKAKPAASRAGRTAKATKTKPPVAGAVSPAPAASAAAPRGLRVRMYRVGFGDFFLLSVPTADPKVAKHILIDCGVHAVDLGSIGDAVKDMARECGGHLSLVIMTHRHADHISGFAKCSDDFRKIRVDRVWMPWFEDPTNKDAARIQANLTALAGQLSLRLAASGRSGELAAMTDNITGAAAAAGSSNQKALEVLHGGFSNQPEHDYYRAGDPAKLPQDLIDAGLSAKLLGPPGDPDLITQMTNTADQYLANAMREDDATARTFSPAFRTASYPDHAFKFFAADKVKALIDGVRPDVLAARAQAADKTLNNQSLVVLFSFGGKNLLFSGDAQWGNWENFLYGGAFGTSGHTKMTDDATQILKNIDFYKVGHHGSRNATPKDAVAAMLRLGCACMCSTQIGAYNEVPRAPLMQALNSQMRGRLARSDQVAAGSEGPNTDVGALPKPFESPAEKLFIDYNF